MRSRKLCGCGKSGSGSARSSWPPSTQRKPPWHAAKDASSPSNPCETLPTKSNGAGGSASLLSSRVANGAPRLRTGRGGSGRYLVLHRERRRESGNRQPSPSTVTSRRPANTARNQDNQQSAFNNRQFLSVTPLLRGEMNSHGKAGQCRSLVVYRDYAAGVCGTGDGVFGVGGDGAGAVWIALCISVEAIDLGGGGPGGDGRHDARGLSALQASGAGVFAGGDYYAAADLRFLS